MDSSNNNSECAKLVHHMAITDYTYVLIPFATLTSLLAAYVVTANVTIITAIVRHGVENYNTILRTSHTSRSMTQLTMASMAVADAVIGLVSMPLGIYVVVNNGKWGLGDGLCQAWICLDKILCTVSIYHVVCLAGDRYTAVCHPLRYRLVHKRTAYILIAVCWTVPVVASVVTLSGGWHHSGVEVLAECLRRSGACQAVYSTPYLVAVSTMDFYIPFAIIFVVYFLLLRQIKVLASVTKNFRRRVSSLATVASWRSLKNLTPLRNFHREADSYSPTSEGAASHNTAFPNIVDTDPPVGHTASPMPKQYSTIVETYAQTLETDSAKVNVVKTLIPGSKPTKGLSVVDVTPFQAETADANAAFHHDGLTHTNLREPTSPEGSTTPHRTTTKAYKTIGCIVLGFTVCWLPFSIFNLVVIYNGYSLPLWIILLLSWMGYVNSALNPVFFCFNKSVRHAVITLLFPSHKGSTSL